MKTACKFCEKFAGDGRSNEAWDEILFASPNFVVVPTVGSIIPGWLLILPRKHYLCVGAMGDGLMHELLELRREAHESLSSRFGPVVSFEHGPAEQATSVGCGIDHAHLHLVATRVDLLNGARQIVQHPLSWSTVAGLEATADYYQRRMPYIYLELAQGNSWVGTGAGIGSQLFRRVIAAASGRKDVFDWKCQTFEANVHQTVQAVKSWKTSRHA